MSKVDCLTIQKSLEHRLTRIETIIGLTFIALLSKIMIDLVAVIVG